MRIIIFNCKKNRLATQSPNFSNHSTSRKRPHRKAKVREPNGPPDISDRRHAISFHRAPDHIEKLRYSTQVGADGNVIDSKRLGRVMTTLFGTSWPSDSRASWINAARPNRSFYRRHFPDRQLCERPNGLLSIITCCVPDGRARPGAGHVLIVGESCVQTCSTRTPWLEQYCDFHPTSNAQHGRKLL